MGDDYFEQEIKPKLTALHDKYIGKKTVNNGVVYDIYWRLGRGVEVKTTYPNGGFMTIDYKDLDEVDIELAKIVIEGEGA